MESSEEGGPSWAYMLPDALASIFIRLSFKEILTVIPTVCRTWMRVSQDAACWQIVDLEEWSRYRNPHTVERMIKLLVSRSGGGLREFSVYGLKSDAVLRSIACSGSHLQVLRIPYSAVSEGCVCRVTSKLQSITRLDISGCTRLSKVAVESFGKYCRRITRLNANMLVNDEVAAAIAQYMPQLRELEMQDGRLSNKGLKVVLDRCKNLWFLDLRRCGELNMEDSILKESMKRLRVCHDPDSELDASDADVYDSDTSLDSDDLDDLEAIYEYHQLVCAAVLHEAGYL